MTSEPNNLSQLTSGESPRAALRVIETLTAEGFVAYFAGGCVRDALLGRTPKDFDVATNATPESVREVFGKRRTLAIGAAFGVIVVLPERRAQRTDATDNPEAEQTEVATFRSDGDYSDGRRPDTVQFGSANEDAQRRDFTINGLFYDPASQQVIDFVDGINDLDHEGLRTIGSAHQRFDEDKLRMLRAVRFATTLDFTIDSDTVAAIRQHAAEINVVSGERIGAEMRRLLASPNAAAGLQTLQTCGLANVVLPELASVDFPRLTEQFEHLSERNPESALACLLINAATGPATLKTISDRWKLSNEEHRRAEAAMKHWQVVKEAGSLPWSTVQPVLVDRDAAWIVNVARAVIAADSATGLAVASDALAWPAAKLDPPPLLSGDDLRAMGIAPGPAYSRILSAIRRDQLDDKIRTQEQARDVARTM